MPPKRVVIDPNAIDPEAKHYRYRPGESVPDSILSFRKSIGRLYETEKNLQYNIRGYPYPNGEPESDCLDIQHAQLLLSFSNKLYLAPIPKEKLFNVMDFGTGTGIWAIDFAIEHPGVNVLGVDPEPFRLNHERENLCFESFDFDPEREWKTGCKFDLIHNRVMFGGLKQAPAFIQHAFECLTTGGYLEMVSFTHPVLLNDGKWPDDCKLKQWSDMIVQAGFGEHPNPAQTYENQMNGAGFKDIKVKRFKWPSSPWPRNEYLKRLGYWQREFLKISLEAQRDFVSEHWGQEHVERYLPKVRKEILNPDFTNIHAYFEIVVVYGRKPVRASERERVMTPRRAQTLEDLDYNPSPRRSKPLGKPMTSGKTPRGSGKTPTKGPREEDDDSGNDPTAREFIEAGIMEP